MEWKQIDNNHYIISAKSANSLSGGKKPRPGYEKLVTYNGKNYFLKQAPFMGKLVWMLHGPTSWQHTETGGMILNSVHIEEDDGFYKGFLIDDDLKTKPGVYVIDVSGNHFGPFSSTAKAKKAIDVFVGRMTRSPRIVHKGESIESNPRPHIVGKIYERCLEIRASKAGMHHECDEACRRAGHHYKHPYKQKACIYAMSDGSILIK